jgi:hypothetical protein
MKNKKDILVGIFTIIVTLGAMIFSINYTCRALTDNTHKNISTIVIEKIIAPKVTMIVKIPTNMSFLQSLLL